MASVGPKTATVGANIVIEGSAWISLSNVASVTNFVTNDFGIGKSIAIDDSVYVVLDGETWVGANARNLSEWATGIVTIEYGGPNHLFSRTWTVSDIKNNPSFGLSITVRDGGFNYSDSLVAKGFSFTELPDDAVIEGIKFTIERQKPEADELRIRNVRCTVYHPGGAITSNGMFLLM